MTTFVKITNNQVYNELLNLKEINEREHNEIKVMLSGYKDQVSRLKWALGGVTTIVFILTGWLWQIATRSI